jgi:3-hydroxybutyryl-CoA dehydrogenase
MRIRRMTAVIAHGYARAAVIGVGLMGRRIAGVLAAGGLQVVLHDLSDDLLSQAVLSAAAIATTNGAGAITGSTDFVDAVSGVDLVIEAVPEDLKLKQRLFAELAELCPDATLASNTSVLPITRIAETSSAADRIIGMHWWNPPDLIPIVELIPGERSNSHHLLRAEALLLAVGKTPVKLDRDGAGFIGNRLQHALWREAITLVAEGVADAETVDLVARKTIGLRLANMGPLANADYIGLDLTMAIHQAVNPVLSRDPGPSPMLANLVTAGRLGAKTGAGFLQWPPGARERAAESLNQHVQAQLMTTERPGDEPKSG